MLNHKYVDELITHHPVSLIQPVHQHVDKLLTLIRTIDHVNHDVSYFHLIQYLPNFVLFSRLLHNC